MFLLQSVSSVLCCRIENKRILIRKRIRKYSVNIGTLLREMEYLMRPSPNSGILLTSNWYKHLQIQYLIQILWTQRFIKTFHTLWYISPFGKLTTWITSGWPWYVLHHKKTDSKRVTEENESKPKRVNEFNIMSWFNSKKKFGHKNKWLVH